MRMRSPCSPFSASTAWKKAGKPSCIGWGQGGGATGGVVRERSLGMGWYVCRRYRHRCCRNCCCCKLLRPTGTHGIPSAQPAPRCPVPMTCPPRPPPHSTYSTHLVVLLEAGPAGHLLPELLVDQHQHAHEVLVGGGARQALGAVRPQVVLKVLADLQQLDPARIKRVVVGQERLLLGRQQAGSKQARCEAPLWLHQHGWLSPQSHLQPTPPLRPPPGRTCAA